jgi:hypothetical protein
MAAVPEACNAQFSPFQISGINRKFGAMIRFWPLLALLAIMLSGCGSEPAEAAANKVPVPPASVQVEAEYPFCGDTHPDRFVLDYQGQESGIFFYIICADGDTLTRHEWLTEAILPDSMARLPEGPKREAAVLHQMRALVIGNPPHKLMEEWPGADPLSEPVRELLAQQGAERVFALQLASGKTQVFAWSPTLQSAIQVL